ncbi:MAG: hypothetical protein PVH37_15885 [Desulfobacterales bacterium]|jgi:hypothetical protein
MSLKLKTQKRQAEIMFSDGHSIGGHFFISPSPKGPAGSENVIEILNDDRSYIPFEIAEGEISLLQKGSIIMVRMAISEMPKDLPYLSRTSTKIFLLSGDILEGNVFIDLPKTRTRLSDFLNFSKRFFFIDVNEQDILVNATFIKMVTPGV